MSFNFPDTPSDGQQFTPSGGPTYVWSASGGVWKLVGGIGAPGNLSISDTPPPSPSPGQMWWESDTGNLFAWFSDADSSQWVQINVPNVSGIATSNAKNRIVNGGFQIAQEIAKGTTTVGYVTDQWGMARNGPTTGGSYAFDSSGGSPAGMTIASAALVYTTIAATDSCYIYQPVEGKRIADFLWGTGAALPAVLRFTAWTTYSSIVISVAIQTISGSHSFVQNFTITPTPTDFIMPIPGPTVGTWARDNTGAMYISFCGLAGTTVTTSSPRTWLAGNYKAATGVGNVWATASQWVAFANVGFYLDATGSGIPPRWEMPDEAGELIACQRYYLQLGDEGSGDSIGAGNATAATLGHATIQFPVRMRVAPTMTVSAAGDFGVSNATSATIATTALTLAGVFTRNYIVGITVASGLVAGQVMRFYGNSASAKFKLSARM